MSEQDKRAAMVEVAPDVAGLETEQEAITMEAEQERINAGVASYIESMGLPETLEAAIAERNAWIETACMFSRNEDYYRGLVDQVGGLFGEEAYIADDGSRSQDILRAKVPELVTRLSAEKEAMREVLEKARDKFLHYADLHYLKCTAEGDEKADRNTEMAEMCDRALSQEPQP